MDNPNVNNLCAAIVVDKRYSELKTAIYENLVNKDHSSVVAVFKAFEEYAQEGKDNTFHESENIIPKPTHRLARPDIDEDLDDSLTEEELKLRK